MRVNRFFFTLSPCQLPMTLSPLPHNIFFVLIAAAFLLVIAYLDLKQRRIPNALIYPAVVVMLLFHLLVRLQSPLATLLGGGLAFLMFALVAWLRPGDLGGGDIKLATLLGITFGFPVVLWALLLGVGSGAVVAVGMIVGGRGRKTHIPYGPFLCLGAIIALFYNPLPLFFVTNTH